MFNIKSKTNHEKSRDEELAGNTVFLKFLRRIMLAICAGVFLYSGYSLYVIGSEYKTGTEEYKDLQRYIKKSQNENILDNNAKIGFNKLKVINSDVVGWICFDNIAINYPIVKGTNNDFYLKHTFKKEENKAGSIFMDYENNSQFKDVHTIIYGHNLKNSSMFSALMKYKNRDFFVSNPCFRIYTPNETLKCDIFSCYITEGSSDSYDRTFSSRDKYENFLKELRKKSLYDTGVGVTADDTILSLSTCTNTNKDSRIIVHAKVLKEKFSDYTKY
ncbi:class B sortase [Clostridium sp. C8-1-8]|uniref:class B sortase n=1 Tax=Clostridium sp. C8-1-8 TaxID=2698831 RepID=UPI0013706BEC|nr:class B sortase [Clostridium sp. C8-1-8]